MAPTRPYLPPLSTPKNMTFPSELQERTYTCLDSAKPAERGRKSEDNDTPITPPSAYTEFLNTFSPIFASPTSSRANFSKYMLDRPRPSPTSAPPSATSFSARSHQKHPTLLPSYSATSRCAKSPRSPDRIHRLRLPPPHVYTPVTASPLSAHPLHRYSSPTEWRFHQLESPASDNGSFSIRQVVTTTITFRRTPQLAPPPAGRRKRTGTRRNT